MSIIKEFNTKDFKKEFEYYIIQYIKLKRQLKLKKKKILDYYSNYIEDKTGKLLLKLTELISVNFFNSSSFQKEDISSYACLKILEFINKNPFRIKISKRNSQNSNHIYNYVLTLGRNYAKEFVRTQLRKEGYIKNLCKILNQQDTKQLFIEKLL